MSKAAKDKTIKIRQVRSAIGTPESHRHVLRGLGLRRIQHTVERRDTPAVRGMVAKVPYLVEVLEEKR
jgi:large subunit ribosomal protein L30